MNNRKIQITDAKVRGFWADSKKLARFLSKLLRQDIGFATKWGSEESHYNLFKISLNPPVITTV